MTQSPGLLDEERSPLLDLASWALVYVIFLFAIPSRLVIPALGSAGAPSMVIGLMSFFLWAIHQIGRPTSNGLEPTFPVRKAAVIFLLAVVVSYAVGMTRPIDADEISPADVALLSVLSWSGALMIAHDGIPSLDRLRRLVSQLAWAGGLLGLLGLLQFLTNDVLVDRISIPFLRPALFEAFERGGFVRPSGTATHPIEFGIILAMMMPFALHSAFTSQGRSLVRRWLPAVVLGVSIALTFSRSAYVAFAISVVILFLGWPPRRRLNVGLAGLGVCVILFVSVPRLFGTITGLFRNVGEDPSISSRTESYDIAFEFILRSPLFGRGLGTFLPKYRIFDNQYLLLLVCLGAVGTAALLWLFFTALRSSLTVAVTNPDPEIRDLGLTIAASIAGGAISLAMFDAFAFPMTMGTLFLVLGLAGAVARLAPREPLSAPGARVKRRNAPGARQATRIPRTAATPAA